MRARNFLFASLQDAVNVLINEVVDGKKKNKAEAYQVLFCVVAPPKIKNLACFMCGENDHRVAECKLKNIYNGKRRKKIR